MKRIVPIAIIVVVLGAVSAFILVLSNQSDSTARTDTPIERPQVVAPAENNLSTPVAGTYTPYTANAIAQTKGVKILFFHAPWCPQCRQLDKSIQDEGVPNGVTILKVDYDTNNELRKKYGVTLQTTLVKVDDQGNLVKKFVAYDAPTVTTVKQQLL